jgi:hypothetical protein
MIINKHVSREPEFTRQLKYKKAGIASDTGTLWCENRCENLIDNNDQNLVTFRPDDKGVDDLVLMIIGDRPSTRVGLYTCNTWAENTFKLTHSTDVILTRHRHDLIDGERVGDPSKEDSPLDAHTNCLRHFQFTSIMVDQLAPMPHLEFFQWIIRNFTVGVLCKHCAAGSKRVSQTQCRHATECCQPCPLNHWKAAEVGACILVDWLHVPVIHQKFVLGVTAPYTQYVTSGANAHETCKRGDILMYKAGGDILIYCEISCAQRMTANSWRTCV